MQCGPAALATVLGATGVDIDPDTLSPQLFLPERQGSLQLEIIGAARRHGRLPYVIDPDANALTAELFANRPVLVLQNLGFRSSPRYHYAVVVGISPDRKVVLRSGAERRLVMDETRFMRAWERADFWAIVVLKPGEIPARADSGRYVKEVAALEALGQWQAAEQSYLAALDQWPDHPVALFGLGNSLLMKKQFDQAAELFRKFLEIYPHQPAALNNLATALLGQGCYKEALAVVDRALAEQSPQSDFTDMLHSTRQEIVASNLDAQGPCSGSPATGAKP